MDEWQWNASKAIWNQSLELDSRNQMWNRSLELDPRNQTRPMTAAAANKWCETVMLFSINTMGAGTLCILGLLGNGISFAILSQDRTTSPVAAFLLESLSIADSAFLVVWLLQFSVKDLFNFFGLDRTCSGCSVAYIYTRAYTYPMAFIAQTTTIWLTVLIAASRYVAVCMPYRASAYCTLPVTKRGTLGVVVFAVLYNLPRFFENEIAVAMTRRNFTRHHLQRTSLGRNRLYQLVYFDALYYVVSFVLPLLLLSVFNAQLIVAYRAVQRKRSAMKMRRCRGGGTDSHEQNITLVMIVVILVFMVCNAPARVVQIVWQYNQKLCPTTPFFVIQLSNVLEVFSSSSNFLVYCGFRKQFRRALRTRVAACAIASRSRDLSDQTTVNATDSPLAADCGGETEVQQSVV